jgi:hypothetical protein
MSRKQQTNNGKHKHSEEIINMSHAFFGSPIDFPFLPQGSLADIQVFQCPGASGAILSPQLWVKPRGAVMCYMLSIGAGGGGGGGFSAASTNARGGGAGGAAGAMATLFLPALFLPESLKILVGLGGSGGTAGNAGSAGTASIISVGGGITAINSGQNIIMSVGAGGAGAQGAAANGGAQTTAPGTPSITMPYIGHIISNRQPGAIGAAGGAQTGAVGASLSSIWQAACVTGGGGGAGVNSVGTGFAGGSVTLGSAIDTPEYSIATTLAAGGTAGGAGAAGPGDPGKNIYKYLWFSGGGGGGSADGGVGGKGGDGAIGSGGGGGGGGTTGGSGGRGGDGLIIIFSW